MDCISTRLWCAKEDKGDTGAGIKWDFSEWKATYLIQIKRFWSSHYCQNTEVTTEDKNLCKSPGNWDISLKKNWRIYLIRQNGNNLCLTIRTSDWSNSWSVFNPGELLILFLHRWNHFKIFIQNFMNFED